MLVTIPFMCRVVSVHRLYTATSSLPNGRMSCSTVSDVNAASSPSWCAWMSCERYILGLASMRDNVMLQDPLLPTTAQPQGGMLYTLWGSLLQAFTVDDMFQRKIK